MSKNNLSKPIVSTASKVTDHPKYVPERDRPMSMDGDFNIAVVGDIVQTRPISQLEDDAVTAAIEPLRKADVAVGNLEQ